MLMSRSQPQPAIIAAAAGGKMMATRMRMMSDPLTMVLRLLRGSGVSSRGVIFRHLEGMYTMW